MARDEQTDKRTNKGVPTSPRGPKNEEEKNTRNIDANKNVDIICCFVTGKARDIGTFEIQQVCNRYVRHI